MATLICAPEELARFTDDLIEAFIVIDNTCAENVKKKYEQGTACPAKDTPQYIKQLELLLENRVKDWQDKKDDPTHTARDAMWQVIIENYRSSATKQETAGYIAKVTSPAFFKLLNDQVVNYEVDFESEVEAKMKKKRQAESLAI